MNGGYTECKTGCSKSSEHHEEVKNAKYVVAYAKITETKDDGINLNGVFFGGLGATQEKADQVARSCVNNTKGGTIIPKIVPIDGPEQVIRALDDATDSFERITDQMIEANKTIVRTQAIKRGK